jgi:hypothetical protein
MYDKRKRLEKGAFVFFQKPVATRRFYGIALLVGCALKMSEIISNFVESCLNLH